MALENALNEQINQMKANHSDYDEFQFQIDEIGHNPYQLISYLTVKYGGFTYAEVADEIQEIFREQYGLYTDSTRETVTEKKTGQGWRITGTGCDQWILQLSDLLRAVEWRPDCKWSVSTGESHDCGGCFQSICANGNPCHYEWCGVCS